MKAAIYWSDEVSKIPYERKSVVVLVDVLRAASTLSYALAAGAPEVYVTKDINVALALKERNASGTIIAGERTGIQLDGFDIGNSPYLITTLLKSTRNKKKTVVLSTGNFSNVIGDIYTAKQVPYILGSLCNARAVAQYLVRGRFEHVYFVPIGTYSMLNYKGKLPAYTEEDLFGCLFIIAELLKLKKHTEISEQEKQALHRFVSVLKNPPRLAQFLLHTLYAESLKIQDKTLGNKKGRVKNINQKDMDFCFRCNKLKIVPKLYKERGMFVVRKK